MPEAEISPAGTVLVEGHHVGELQGFRFTADQTAGGEDAKAVKAAAQKALAAEFEARAERFSACANGDIALGSDGILRWIGAPVGTLVQGEDPLRPRTLILADEQLTGPSRDKVSARAERFVNFQIDTLLKPLIDLKGAEHVAGIGRGVAFRLAENFGLINRRDIADDIKALDQEGRAALRRMGVRFGAYHIFVPALIKPAPAGLITLLWALANDGKDKSGFGDVVNALASGRTSVVIDPEFDLAFYKLAGYRPLGRRAVRVDILERLADLIRPALSWKTGVGARPDGAYDGSAFIVTPAMMSILGANSDDIEEILKGLGYRSEAKPAAEVKARLETIDQAARDAAEALAAKVEAEKAALEAASAIAAGDAVGVADEPSVEAANASTMDQPSMEDGDVPEAPASLPVEEAASPDAASVAPAEAAAAPLEAPAWAPKMDEPPLEMAPAVSVPQEADAPDVSEPETTAEATADDAMPPIAAANDDDASVADATPETAVSAEEPKPILLWRQGRSDQRRGGHRPDQRHRGGSRPNAVAAEGGPQPAGDRPPQEGRRNRNERPDGQPKPKFDRERFKRPPGQPAEGGRPDHRQGRPQGEGGRRDGRAENGKDDRPGKPASQPRPREERPVQVDPLSPFAKLAALRDLLKK